MRLCYFSRVLQVWLRVKITDGQKRYQIMAVLKLITHPGAAVLDHFINQDLLFLSDNLAVSFTSIHAMVTMWVLLIRDCSHIMGQANPAEGWQRGRGWGGVGLKNPKIGWHNMWTALNRKRYQLMMVWNSLELSGTLIWDSLGPPETLWDCQGLCCGTLWDSLGLSETVWDCLGLFWSGLVLSNCSNRSKCSKTISGLDWTAGSYLEV